MTIYLEYILDKQLLCSISEIEFSHLRQLNLSGNNIESVEVFHRIRMPDIEEIRIFNDFNDFKASASNYVSNISQLRKINFPHFKGVILRTILVTQTATW